MVGVRDLLRSGRLGKLIERLRTHMAHTYGEASFKMIHAEQQHSNASVAAQLSSCGFRTKRKNQKQIAAFHYASGGIRDYRVLRLRCSAFRGAISLRRQACVHIEVSLLIVCNMAAYAFRRTAGRSITSYHHYHVFPTPLIVSGHQSILSESLQTHAPEMEL